MSKLEANDNIKNTAKKIYFNTILWALSNKDKFHYIQQIHFSPHLSQIPAEVSLEQTKMHTEFIEQGKAKGAIKPPVLMPVTMVNSGRLPAWLQPISKPAPKAPLSPPPEIAR